MYLRMRITIERKEMFLGQMLLVLVVALDQFGLVHSQSGPVSISGNATTTTLAMPPNNKTDSETTTTATDTTGGETLLSGNEYVDFTETPTLLVDELRTNSNGSSPIETRPQNSKNSSETSETTTTTPEQVTSTLKTQEAPEEEPMLDEEEEAGVTKVTLFEPPQNVSQYMDYIERLFHDLRHQITDLFEPHIPQLIRTSQMVQLSSSCSYDMLRMALALRQFEPWALRMIDSSGKVPEGIFEGSFTALGSYDECLATVFGGPQQPSTKGKYCLVNVSPYLPPKPPADRAERIFQEEANRRNYTKDDQFARLSPMFYYMKFRIGVCIPSTCLEQDLDSISSALSSSLRLNITIPHCRVQQAQPLTKAQLVGGLVFGLVLALVLGSTLMDYWRRKLDQMKRRELLVFDQMGEGHLEATSATIKAASLHHLLSVPITTTSSPADGVTEYDGRSASISSILGKSSRERFNNRLERHWSWMSFSLLANFKLYFVPSKECQVAGFSCSNIKEENSKTPKSSLGCQEQPSKSKEHNKIMVGHQQPIIKCLDGIRVLSLCWVIVANSYITLDPRATKRLTITREAPKDFLFQIVVQASLAIETFFFLSGLLVSLSFARRLLPTSNQKQENQENTKNSWLHWLQFYVHRYVRMTPATMLVIAFTMFAFRFGDGPLWVEATHKAHTSCSENWWRHLVHVANFIDTRQMCFIHYWYIAADMQLFLFAPLLMFLLHRSQRVGYALATLIGLASIGNVFYTTYMRQLPPTLLFYNSDPESRREYGNTIMTKPLTHVLPYMVGILVGKWLFKTNNKRSEQLKYQEDQARTGSIYQNNRSLTMLFGMVAGLVALAEIFLPYKWNNSHLPTRLIGAIYAALFRLCWALVLAYLVVSCAHKRDRRCRAEEARRRLAASVSSNAGRCCCLEQLKQRKEPLPETPTSFAGSKCVCGAGGNLLNRLLSLSIFTHLSKLSFVAYLIHLPLMSVFISQTRGLFAFSHSLVIHLALSYLVMTFFLSFILVHIIEFPFITFERYLFAKLTGRRLKKVDSDKASSSSSSSTSGRMTTFNADADVNTHNISETFRISERL